jgi:hypothetical protein
MMRTVQIDPARIRARHEWFRTYADVLVQQLGAPAVAFRDDLLHSVPNFGGLPFERLHQNLIAAHLAGNLLYGHERFVEAISRLRQSGWVTQDIRPLAERFTDHARHEGVVDRKQFGRVGVNLLVWRMSVRVAAHVPLERVEEELMQVWGDDKPSVFLEEAIRSAALPAPPSAPEDDVERRLCQLTCDDGFQAIFGRRIAEYDHHAWAHPDLPDVINRWATVSLISALHDADIRGFSDPHVLERCAETRRVLADWISGCTEAEATLAMPTSRTDH